MPDDRPSILWFRRDLRLGDHPALMAAAEQGPVTALFVLDDRLLRASGAPRTAYLLRTLRALDTDLRKHGGRLVLRRGRPEQVVPALAKEVTARAVHLSADYAPYGAARDRRVEAALGDVPVIATGSPYAVAPGRVLKQDGDPYKVFTPFHRAWLQHGWRRPADSDPATVTWRVVDGDDVPDDPEIDADLPDAGEQAALAAWASFRDEHLAHYEADRNRPDLDHTSRMSPHLKLGTIHPRTMLVDCGRVGAPYARQLAWRDFYAHVLHHWPNSAHGYFKPEMAAMTYDGGAAAGRAFEAWAGGQTGFPIVDAGMRQLLATGWMHNRVRMIVASFLVKDLHLEWTRGARHFMDHLIDGDLASNQHGWQWTAGTGTDASPYFRVFNPISQGQKFDPRGDYVRRWVPELKGLSGKAVHEPWTADPVPVGYPAPIVDHATERVEALERYAAVTRQH
ncbi:cryptochrome/photolyase family protein [Lapillicoccus sp.]|uniref:cryptochrome/photolyase family protein n=1 Tax=Lapillicoccus sp. TaxID=1909287 RepID=UPI0039834491